MNWAGCEVHVQAAMKSTVQAPCLPYRRYCGDSVALAAYQKPCAFSQLPQQAHAKLHMLVRKKLQGRKMREVA